MMLSTGMPGWRMMRNLKYHEDMNTGKQKLELSEADLLGYAPSDLECKQCGGVFCGLRVGRIYDGKPLIMCSNKEETKEVLAGNARKN